MITRALLSGSAIFDGFLWTPVYAGSAVLAVMLPDWSLIFHSNIANRADFGTTATAVALVGGAKVFIKFCYILVKVVCS